MPPASSQASSFSAGEAVLGLVIERPGDSNELERRLARRFGAAQFVHGTAHQAVKRLARQGLIRAVDGNGSAPPAGGFGAKDGASAAYEATAEGVTYFEGWLWASSGIPPVRESLHVKIAFCKPADLPRMVEIVREAELACMARVEELNEQRRRERRSLGDDEWGRLMGLIVTTGDAVWWDARLKWLQMLRRCLQEEGQRYTAGLGVDPSV